MEPQRPDKPAISSREDIVPSAAFYFSWLYVRDIEY